MFSALSYPVAETVSPPRPSGRQAIDLDALFRCYWRELNSYAYGRLKDREAAADIVQDSFLRFLVWHRSPQARDLPQGPRFFLWRIVGNLTIDLARRNRRIGSHATLEDAGYAVADPRPGPDRTLESKQTYRLLKAALDELPLRCRSALLLSRLEGLTHAEIARRLSISPSMVSKYIVAVLEHCLDRLPDDFH